MLIRTVLNNLIRFICVRLFPKVLTSQTVRYIVPVLLYEGRHRRHTTRYKWEIKIFKYGYEKL